MLAVRSSGLPPTCLRHPAVAAGQACREVQPVLHPVLFKSTRRAFAALIAAGCAAALAAPSADAACISTPVNQQFADTIGDAPTDLAPEISALTVSVDSSCGATFGYAIVGQDELWPGDFLGWFIDADGNASTGSPSAFVGADYSLGRDSDSALLMRWDSGAGKFVAAGTPTLVGPFGVQVDLSSISGFGSRVITVAGGSSWRSSSGTSYFDWAPTPGAAPFALGISLNQYVPTPPPAPVLPTPAPTPVPTPPPAAGGTTPQSAQDEQYSCEVPRTKGLPLAQAKARLRHAGCTPGAVHYARSLKYAKGRVIRLSHPTYALLMDGERVQITVSSGPGPRRSNT